MTVPDITLIEMSYVPLYLAISNFWFKHQYLISYPYFLALRGKINLQVYDAQIFCT